MFPCGAASIPLANFPNFRLRLNTQPSHVRLYYFVEGTRIGSGRDKYDRGARTDTVTTTYNRLKEVAAL
jgi:hypothetical protein